MWTTILVVAVAAISIGFLVALFVGLQRKAAAAWLRPTRQYRAGERMAPPGQMGDTWLNGTGVGGGGGGS